VLHGVSIKLCGNEYKLLSKRFVLFTSTVSSYKNGFVNEANIAIPPGYRLYYRGPSVRFPAGAGNFSLQHRIQTGSEAHLASYPMGTRGSFPGG
jgi:hypothetical protein